MTDHARQLQLQRRVRFLQVPPVKVLQVLAGQIRLSFPTLPPDVLIVDVEWDWTRGVFAFCVAHPDFEPAADGNQWETLECAAHPIAELERHELRHTEGFTLEHRPGHVLHRYADGAFVAELVTNAHRSNFPSVVTLEFEKP